MSLDKKKLTDLLNEGKLDDAKELIGNYYRNQNELLLNKFQRISFTETFRLDKFENAKLNNLKGTESIKIGLSKHSNAIWFIVFLLGTVLFSFIYWKDPKSIIVASIIGGICVLGFMVTGYNLIDRKPKLIITPNTLIYDYNFKSQVNVSDILIAYIYKDYDTVNEDSRLIIYKINKADPEEWLLYNLEYGPEDMGHLIERIRNKSY